MRLLLNSFTLLILIFFSTFSLRAQEELKPENVYGVCISVTPHIALASTMRLDVDKQILRTDGWVIASLSYTRRVDDWLWGFNFDKLETYGGSFSYRHYFFGNEKPRILYVQSGAVFNFTSVDYSGYEWEPTYYNGSEALQHVNKYKEDEIVQYGADFKVGCVLKCNRFIFFDFYAGVGFRGSDVLSPNSTKYYDGEFLSPAYTGPVPLAGVRFGVNL